MGTSATISSWSQKRLREQGFTGLSGEELYRHRLGIRFAYFTCLCLVLAGLVFKEQTFLIIANVVALLGILPPRHPIDYIFNYGVRFILGRPELPRRPVQGRFACIIATALLLGINYFYYVGNFTVVYVFAAVLLTSAVLVTFSDLCIPSLIYNALFGIKPEK